MSDQQRGPFSDMHDEFNPKKLDVLAALREAYSGAWNNLSEMLRLIWLPGSLYLAFSLVGGFLPLEGNLLLGALVELATFFLWAIVSVAWYRFILVGAKPDRAYQINFGRREARFLFVCLGLVMLAVPSLLFGGPPEFPPAEYMRGVIASAGAAGSLIGFFGIMLSFVGIYFLVRLLLLLPAVAIDEPLNVRMVLERTRGNFWRIAALSVLASLPLLVIVTIVLAAGLPVFLAMIFSSLVSIFFAIVNVAVLAIAYRELIGPPGAMAADLDRQDTV
tara:strand:+ start:481 stop:1308 length:828 start_codon:yes stop_codon:yes gene_type:complete